MRRGDYGYDAPYALVIFGLISAATALGAAIFLRQGLMRPATLMTLYSIFFLGNFGSFLYTTRRGKFLEWDRILDRLRLRGDEAVLDMGCGRGAVMTAVARRLTAGRVTGVDIWSTKDQSGNARDVTIRNASLEGVAGVCASTPATCARFPIRMRPSISWSRASPFTTSDRTPIAGEPSSRAFVS